MGFCAAPATDVIPGGVSLDTLNVGFLDVPQYNAAVVQRTVDRLKASGPPNRAVSYTHLTLPTIYSV